VGIQGTLTPLLRQALAADKIAEFTSACAEVLDEGTSEGPQHGAIIQSVVPPVFLRDEREEEVV